MVVLESVASLSSSSGPMAQGGKMSFVKVKSCGSLGTECLTIVMGVRLTFVKVQVTDSPGSTLIVATPVPVLPLLFASLQLIELRSHPATGPSVTDKVPGTTLAQTLVLGSVAS